MIRLREEFRDPKILAIGGAGGGDAVV